MQLIPWDWANTTDSGIQWSWAILTMMDAWISQLETGAGTAPKPNTFRGELTSVTATVTALMRFSNLSLIRPAEDLYFGMRAMRWNDHSPSFGNITLPTVVLRMHRPMI